MTRLIGFFVLSFLSTSVLLGQSVNISKAGFSAEGLARYEAFLNQEINDKKVAGAVSMIYRKGSLAHSNSLGANIMSTGAPMNDDQIFYVQSMTKPIISIAFMTLYEEGHFFLDDPVSKFLPEFANLKVVKLIESKNSDGPEVVYEDVQSPVLIWHLLSHTGGFSHGLGQNEYDKKLFSLLYEQPHKSIKERVGALVSYPLMGHPGRQWNYSASPDVLALLIEHFSGQTADQFLQDRIFKPLGMNHTGYNVTDADVSKVAGLHQMNSDGTLASIDPWGPSQGNTVYGGTHGIFSTAGDYLTFGKMLLNNGTLNGQRIIGRKTLELMTENHIEGLPYAPGNGFGLGFGVRTDLSDSKISGSEGIFHWSGAFNTYFFVDPKEDMVAVLMTQSWPYNNFYAQKMRQLIYSAIDD